MKSKQDGQQDKNEEKNKSNPINYFTLNIENRRGNPTSKINPSTKNNPKKNTTVIKKPINQPKKEIKITNIKQPKKPKI